MNKDNLPRISFKLGSIDASEINEPYCICDHCDKIIYKTNFYHCEEWNCLVQPKFSKTAIAERLINMNELQKLKTK